MTCYKITIFFVALIFPIHRYEKYATVNKVVLNRFYPDITIIQEQHFIAPWSVGNFFYKYLRSQITTFIFVAK